MVFIYVLQLEHNKYYVGKTSNPSFRLAEHFSSNGSVWTKKYRPISVLELIPNCDDYDEDKYTIKYMGQYGINNVRGGSFCEIKLSDSNIVTLKQIITSSTDKCYICGKVGHYAKECKQVSVKSEKIPIINPNEKCDCPTSYFSSHRRGKCLLNKVMLYFDEEDENIDRLANCVEEPKCIEEPKQVTNTNTNTNICSRCGRSSHDVSSCYAKTHINGNKLTTA